MEPIMTEAELREENARLELQCQAHEKREAELNAQEAKLNARLAGMAAWEQQLHAKELSVKDREAECTKADIALGERELILKEREIAINSGQLSENLNEQEKILREQEAELDRREKEFTKLQKESYKINQRTQRNLTAREDDLDERERALDERERALDVRERSLVEREDDLESLKGELNEKEAEMEIQDDELKKTAQTLRDWARDIKKYKPAPPKSPSVIDLLKNEVAELRISTSKSSPKDNDESIPSEKDSDASKSAKIELTPGTISIKDALSYVPKFNGSSATVSDFIRSCKRACSMLPSSAEFMFLTLVRQKFEGEARTAVENMDYGNIKEFENLLRSVFDRKRSANQYKADMENIIMKPDENMVSYVNRARTIYRDILNAEKLERGELSERETNKIDKDTITAFLNGIPSLLQMQCKLLPHDSLEQTYASAIEAFKNQEINSKRFKEQSPTSSVTEPAATVATVAHVRSDSTNNNSNNNSNKKKSGKNNKNLKCDACGGRYHTEDQCWKKLIPGFVALNSNKDESKSATKKAIADKPKNSANNNKNGENSKGGNKNANSDETVCPCCGKPRHTLDTCIKFASLVLQSLGTSGNSNLSGKNDSGFHGSPSSSQNPPKNATTPSTSQQQ